MGPPATTRRGGLQPLLEPTSPMVSSGPSGPEEHVSPVKAMEVKEQGRTAREDGGRGRGLGSPGTSARPCPLAQAPGPAPRSPRARSQAAGKCECQHGDATFLRSLSRPRGCHPRLGPARKATLVGPGLSCPPPAAHPWNALLPASRGFGCPRGPPAGPRLSSVFPGGLQGCRCLQRAGYFGGHPLKENRAGMLEAEHPVPEAWVWPLEPGGAGEEGRGHRGREGAGGRTAPGGAQGRPSEAACPSAKQLTSWASFSRLQGGQRGRAGRGQDDRTVHLVLLRCPLRAGPGVSPLLPTEACGAQGHASCAPPRGAKSRNLSPEGMMLGHPRPQEALGPPNLPCPRPPTVLLASPGPLEGPDRRALERRGTRGGTGAWR